MRYENLVHAGTNGGWRRARDGGWERQKPGEPGTIQWSRYHPAEEAEPMPSRGLTVARSSVATRPRPRATAKTRATAVSVFLTGQARRQLSRQYCDRGVEVGGALFGFYDRPARQLVVRHLVEAGEGTQHGLHLHVREILRIAEAHRATTGWRLCGTWHSYPTPFGMRPGEQGHLSETDLQALRNWWTKHADEEMPAFAEMVVSEKGGCGRGSGWRYPRIDAWLVEEAAGNLVIREATVEIESGWETA